jgi:hypothetical protein
VAFSPQANYTDWAAATCRRNLVPTFADRGVSRGQRGGSRTAVNLSFIDRSLYFFFQVAPHLSSRSWVDPVPGPRLLICGSAGNRTRDLWVCSQEHWPLDHRVKNNTYICFQSVYWSSVVLDWWLCNYLNGIPLPLPSTISGGSSVGIVRLRAKNH